MISDIVSKFMLIIEPFIKEKGFDLVDVKSHYAGREIVVSLLIDRPGGGITIGECGELNKEIRFILEKDLMPDGNFVLEISSPGLDRPLVEYKDFLKALHCDVRVFLREAMGAGFDGRLKKEFEGELLEVLSDTIKISAKDGILVIPISNIVNAKRVI